MEFRIIIFQGVHSKVLLRYDKTKLRRTQHVAGLCFTTLILTLNTVENWRISLHYLTFSPLFLVVFFACGGIRVDRSLLQGHLSVAGGRLTATDLTFPLATLK